MEKEEYLLRQKTALDLALVGYMMFLNDKGLLEEGKKYVEGFLGSLTKSEMEEFLERNRKQVEQEGQK